jgi:hypothetical protein
MFLYAVLYGVLAGEGIILTDLDLDLFQPYVKLNSVYFFVRKFQYSVKKFKILTPMTLTRKIKQSKLAWL